MEDAVEATDPTPPHEYRGMAVHELRYHQSETRPHGSRGGPRPLRLMQSQAPDHRRTAPGPLGRTGQIGIQR